MNTFQEFGVRSNLSISLLVCWIVHGYCKEKLLVNHFWELNFNQAKYSTQHIVLHAYEIKQKPPKMQKKVLKKSLQHWGGLEPSILPL